MLLIGLPLLLALATVPTLAGLGLPAPTGGFAVGREHVLLTDPVRPEPRTPDPRDRRQVPLTLWYPAEAATGERAPYLDNLDALSDGLVAGGELSSLQVTGLRFVRGNARSGAAIARDRPSYPLVLLSPGNATNVAFYATYAEELASNGFIVAGVDHPFQSLAVLLGDGSMAGYGGDPPQERAEDVTDARIAERVADLRLVLDNVAARGEALLDGRIDVSSVGVMGHSNGGLAACRPAVTIPVSTHV